MKPVLIQYATCGTCRKAAQWLRDEGIRFDVRDIVLEPPSEKELAHWIPRSGMSPLKWFNTSGERYRELGLKGRIQTASLQDLIRLLASDGKLIKRPVLVWDGGVLTGFKEEHWHEALSERTDP